MTFSHALTHMKAKNLAPGKHFDGQGLMLVKHRKDAGKWILRVVISGKRREMGLGRWPDVSISEAREHAAKARKKVRQGDDPIAIRDATRRKSKRLSVKEAIEQC
ncbi:MAG: Arm DNA-binding domain-containing protein [Pseudomonadota bacterium]